MFSGFYTVASGMLTQQRALNVQANNVANINTPGFKSEDVVCTTFQQQLLTRIEGGQQTYIGKGSPIRLVEDVASRFDASMLEETGRPFDVAIAGEGYFNVMVGERRMLTRNGNFDIDEEGYLVLRGAGRVQGESGDLQVDGANFTITGEGEVLNARGRRIDDLLLSRPAEGTTLEKFTNGLYVVPQGQEETALEEVDGVYIIQNCIERSNVDMNRELTTVIETQRNFQSCNNALKTIDQMNQKTANMIASL